MVSELNGCTILVADDERYITTIISLKLRQAGSTVITASDGEQALELALEHLPDLVCADYQMSPMSGLELAEQLKADQRTAHIPILLLNSHGHRIALGQLADTNIRALLPKPFSTRELLARVQELALERGVAA